MALCEPKTLSPKPQLGFGVPYFNTFFLKGTLISLYFFLPGYLKAQSKRHQSAPASQGPKTPGEPKAKAKAKVKAKAKPEAVLGFRV